MGNDISGFADPDYLPAAAAAGATVVATHIRLGAPGARPRARSTTTWWSTCATSWSNGPSGPRRPASPAERIVLDAGLDLGKTAAQSLTLLRAPRPWPDSATRSCCRRPTRPSSASPSTWRSTERRDASLAAAALGLAWGCRILRVHDVKGTVPRRAMRAR